MLLVPGGEGELDLRARDRQVHALSVVVDGENVDPLTGDKSEQPDQLAGPVLDSCSHDEKTAGLREAVARDLDQKGRIDVASGEERAGGTRTADLAGDERRHGSSPGPFDVDLHAFEEEDDRLGDLLGGDRDDPFQSV